MERHRRGRDGEPRDRCAAAGPGRHSRPARLRAERSGGQAERRTSGRAALRVPVTRFPDHVVAKRRRRARHGPAARRVRGD